MAGNQLIFLLSKHNSSKRAIPLPAPALPHPPAAAAPAHAHPCPTSNSSHPLPLPHAGLVSTSITLFNRAVFSVYHFNYPSFVTLVQILVSLVYMYGLNWAGWMELGSLSVATARKVRWSLPGQDERKGAQSDCDLFCTRLPIRLEVGWAGSFWHCQHH